MSVPLEGTILNSVNLNLYETGLELGLKMVKGKLDTVLMGQKPKSWASGMETSTSFLYFVISCNLN